MENFNKNDLLYPGDDILVKKYRTGFEKKLVKWFLLAVCFLICLLGLALLLFANDLIYLLPSVWFAVPLAIIIRKRKPGSTKQRKRITKKMELRDKKREYNRKMKDISSRNAAIKADKEAKEALAKEMAIVDERLKEALKPIVWDSPEKPIGVWSKAKSFAPAVKDKTTFAQERSRKSKCSVKRDFKIISVDKI